MRITTKGRYALRASLALAMLAKNGAPVSINTLAESENISLVFLEQIFFKLRKAGIVSSTRGPNGGFCFARPLDNITVKQLIDAAGEKLEFPFCNKRLNDCQRLDTCISHYVWLDVMDMVNDYFNNITLASILKKHDDETAILNQNNAPTPRSETRNGTTYS